MSKVRDKNILYDRTSIDIDNTGVYKFYWYDGERVALQRIEDYTQLNLPNREAKNKKQDSANMQT